MFFYEGKLRGSRSEGEGQGDREEWMEEGKTGQDVMYKRILKKEFEFFHDSTDVMRKMLKFLWEAKASI